jgi:hypothetical protein
MSPPWFLKVDVPEDMSDDELFSEIIFDAGAVYQYTPVIRAMTADRLDSPSADLSEASAEGRVSIDTTALDGFAPSQLGGPVPGTNIVEPRRS